jgi:hypothetical protein
VIKLTGIQLTPGISNWKNRANFFLWGRKMQIIKKVNLSSPLIGLNTEDTFWLNAFSHSTNYVFPLISRIHRTGDGELIKVKAIGCLHLLMSHKIKAPTGASQSKELPVN